MKDGGQEMESTKKNAFSTKELNFKSYIFNLTSYIGDL
jgi:hypothetical protein